MPCTSSNNNLSSSCHSSETCVVPNNSNKQSESSIQVMDTRPNENIKSTNSCDTFTKTDTTPSFTSTCSTSTTTNSSNISINSSSVSTDTLTRTTAAGNEEGASTSSVTKMECDTEASKSSEPTRSSLDRGNSSPSRLGPLPGIFIKYIVSNKIENITLFLLNYVIVFYQNYLVHFSQFFNPR